MVVGVCGVCNMAGAVCVVDESWDIPVWLNSVYCFVYDVEKQWQVTYHLRLYNLYP